MSERFVELLSIACVSDRAAGMRWYATFFGRPADQMIGEEALWQVGADAWLVVDERAERAGACTITFAVRGVQEIVERLAASGIVPDEHETYGNGVQHATFVDPDGNAMSIAGVPEGT
ncbi:VOC family protein [Agrococcus sp. KRD186]|uniref:VOC family protein n=1 Tax=Agrococcus sp. KRD186 TaxID=2729730 RepID=UPI0019D2BE9B|nr:VOC family protein [Agrococcus sp. KRD186]